MLLYRGSDDGWDFKDFYDRCDNMGPTIIFYQIENGDCIGGYVEVSWSGQGCMRDD